MKLLKFSPAVFALVAPVAGEADTLGEALAIAYRTNPSINAARASLRATD